MFDAIRRAVASQLGPSFDAGRFGDPAAEQTDWSSTTGGPRVLFRRLVRVGPNRMVSKLALGPNLRVLSLGYGVGLLLVLAAVAAFASGSSFVLLLGLGLGWLTLFTLLARFLSTPITFDTHTGRFHRGHGKPPADDAAGGRIEDVRGIQLLCDLHREDVNENRSRSYFVYEMNLVLVDGKRVQVVFDKDESRFREQSTALSEFIDRPVWDGIEIGRGH